MKISIIVSSFNRGDLLQRSIITWYKQTFPQSLYELVIVDDGSDDDTFDIVKHYGSKFHIKYIKMKKEPDVYRGHTVGYNRALKEAEGDLCIFTHPEIMFPKNALKHVYDYFEKRQRLAKYERLQIPYLTLKPLWLPPADYDSVDWIENIYSLCSFLDFNESMEGKPIDYRAQTQMLRDDWGSTTTFCMRRIDLANMGGFLEFDCWGPDDINMADRRRLLNMESDVLQGTFVFHQNHDNHKASNRISMEEVFSKTPKMKEMKDTQGPLKLSDFKPF